jgi:hypothetical protein
MPRQAVSRQAAAVILMAVLFGCAGGNRTRSTTAGSSTTSATGSVTPPAEAMSDTQLAAHAGNAKFPTSRATDDHRVAAIVSRDRRIIKLYNFESAPIRAVNVWVNGSYVQPINGIAGQSKAVIRTDKLYNGLGNTFASRNEEVARVQLETQDGLYNVMGPATE